MNRIQETVIVHDLNKKLVLLVGPRQVGKTWLAKCISKKFQKPVYLNYDQSFDKKIMLEQSWLNNTDLLILDELHKMPEWKNYLKGVFDTKSEHLKILVTGSARLDIFDQIGDSLAGRYFRHRLLPLSISELKQCGQPSTVEQLLERGGFPEPFFSENEVDATRWRAQYINSMLSTDVFDFNHIQNIRALRLLVELLQQRVGSQISYTKLSEHLQISATTVIRYVEILESLYVLFRVTPYSHNIARSLIKEPKIYFFDTGLVQGDIGAKFENLMAVSLLKHVYAKVDYQGLPYTLQYLRTKDGLEVDFAIVHNQEIEHIIEAKTSDLNIHKPLKFFQEKYQLKATQVVLTLPQEYEKNGIAVVKAQKFLETLDL